MKRLTGQVEAFGIISDNATLYSYRGAHRLIPCGALVAIVVRSAGLRGAGEIERINWDVWCLVLMDARAQRLMTADVCRVKYSDPALLASRISGTRRLE